MSDDRLTEYRRKLWECSADRRMLVGYVAGTMLDPAQWRDPEIRRAISELPGAQQIVEEARKWLKETTS